MDQDKFQYIKNFFCWLHTVGGTSLHAPVIKVHVKLNA